jgi:hypothetical protein
VLGKRVLLLGESNYDPSDTPTDDPNIVRENVENCVFKGSVRFFTKAAKLVLMAAESTSGSREQVHDLWHRVAFTNYVQRVLRRARERPLPDDWTSARPALLKVLADHKPDVIVAMGLHLGSHLEWVHTVAANVALATVAHPSSFGFTYEKWVPQVKQAFLARGAR